MVDVAAVEAVMAALPGRFRGPGGVAGVLHEGRVVAATAWGHADLGRRRAMTRAVRLPVCSITKQFTCAAVLGAVGAPEALDGGLPALMPRFQGALPTVRDLCNNQSGLRDYWALTVLQGARAEQTFARADAAPLIARYRTGHFAPGTRYSYSNGNFRILADLLEQATGEDMATLYARHIWQPAGMETAVLAADTRHPADEVVGYEGNILTGFVPADNGIWWMGDAGMAASLDDMLAYERWVDAGRDTPEAIYSRLAEPQVFRDGTRASYSFGLSHSTVAGRRFTGHGGALRGFRSYRMYCAEQRLSVVVMFNHQADAQGAAQMLAKAALGWADPAPLALESGWQGRWICPETGLTARLEPGAASVVMRFGTSPEELRQVAPGRLGSAHVTLERQGDRLLMRRPLENLVTMLEPFAPVDVADGAEIAGRYASDELGAEMVIEANGPSVAVWFDGMLGQGPAELAMPVGPDLWIVSTRRSMDAPAPGDWTLQIRRDGAGRVAGARLGCWLARGLDYRRTA